MSELPLGEDQETLGSEFCSGYSDVLGKWNSGFYCPNEGSTENLFCCGTGTYKYCCSRREQVTPRDYLASLPLVFGVLLVVVAAVGIIALVVLASCCLCSCCTIYKKRQPRMEVGSLYRLQCSSTASGVANMYSFSNSLATTPIDTELTHAHMLVDIEASNSSPRSMNNGRAAMQRGHTFSSDTLPRTAKPKCVAFEAGVGGEEGDGMKSPGKPLFPSGPYVIGTHRQSSVELPTPGTDVRPPPQQFFSSDPLPVPPSVLRSSLAPPRLVVPPTNIPPQIKTIPSDDSLFHSTKF